MSSRLCSHQVAEGGVRPETGLPDPEESGFNVRFRSGRVRITGTEDGIGLENHGEDLEGGTAYND